MSNQREPGVAIEDLNDAERRLYELAKQSMPLAELAVRLGVPIGDADRRIMALLARLNLPDRAALQQPMPPPVESLEWTGAEAPGGTAPQALPAHRRTISRRAFIGGAVAAGGLVAGSAAGAVLLTGGGPKPKPTSLGTPTPSAPPAADPLALIRRNDAAWSRGTWLPGQLIDWNAGIFFMDVVSGAVEGWRPIVAYIGGPTVLAYGELMVGAVPGDDAASAFHRRLGRGWQWPGTQLSLAAATDKYLVFEELKPRPDGPGQPTGKFHVLDFDLNEVSAFREPPSRFQQTLQLSPDGTKAAVWSEPESGSSPRLVRVDLATGKAESGLTVQLPYGALANLGQGVTMPITGDFLAPVGFSPAPTTDSATSFEPVWFRLSWYRTWEDVTANRGTMPSRWAPDAALYCEEVALRGFTGGGGEGGGENWPAVVVKDQAGATQFVVESAALNYGDALGNSRWLADSSAFVAMVDSGATEGAGWSRIGYALVQADGSKLDMLPAPRDGGGAGADTPYYRGAIPHPQDAALVAFGHLDMLDRRSNRFLHANLPPDAFPGHVQPWSGRRTELTFSLPHGGHGGGGTPSLISPKIVKTLPADTGGELPVRIRGQGECLNLRGEPTLDSQPLTCLADGSVLLVADQPAFADGRRPQSFDRNGDGAWAYVQAGAGQFGWVSSSYLEWVNSPTVPRGNNP